MKKILLLALFHSAIWARMPKVVEIEPSTDGWTYPGDRGLYLVPNDPITIWCGCASWGPPEFTSIRIVSESSGQRTIAWPPVKTDAFDQSKKKMKKQSQAKPRKIDR